MHDLKALHAVTLSVCQCAQLPHRLSGADEDTTQLFMRVN